MTQILTPAEREQVETTIGEIEKRTAAELVVVTAEACAHYYEVKLSYALMLAFAVGALGHTLAPEWSVPAILWLQLGAAIACVALCSLPAVLRLVVPRALMQQYVEQRAELAFLEHGVFATRDRTGVLILVSALEHRVAILGDEGIHKKLQAGGWQRHVTELTKAIAAGRGGEGVCNTLREIGDLLIAEFPPRPDDTDELSNAVRDARR
ncbi:MAG TPA: TPM domain-containing protein [Polyangiales bacterium]|nr:TPM domain-containing protein [Polyangiales bacterium]